jgi:hypothetical protein
MKPQVILPMFLCLTGFSQSSGLRSVAGGALTGAIERIGDAEVQIKTQSQSVTVYTDHRTEVIKGRGHYHDLSALRLGDEIRVRRDPRSDASRLTATDISADTTTFRGFIEKINPVGIEVRVEARGSGQLSPATFVRIYSDTKLGAGSLKVGEKLHIFGWEFGDRGIDAMRIAVYNTDLPLRVTPRPRR